MHIHEEVVCVKYLKSRGDNWPIESVDLCGRVPLYI